MEDEEFVEMVAIGNTLPGPINTKMAAFIGYKVGGVLGSVTALIGAVLPTTVMMVVLMTTLSFFADEPWAQGMSRAMVPVVCVMLAVVCWQFLTVSAKGLGWLVTIVHVIVVSLLLVFFINHPAIVLAGLFVWALVGHKIIKLMKPRQTRGPQ